MTSHPDPNSAAQAQRDRYHILKTDPDVFQAVLSGAKTFEIRLNDRGYAVGDVLGLRETKHTGAEMRAGAPLEYTGRECQRFVSHVLTGYGLADGWCCLSFRLPHATGAGAPVAVPPAPAARTEQATGHDRLLRALATQEAKDGIGALDALYDLAVKHGASKTAAAGFAHVANGAFAALEGQVHDEIRRRSIVAQAIAPVAGEAVNADFLASWEAQRHAGNEWADMATNGIQWMRNVKDGISTPEKALECLASDLAHCRATQARAGITPPVAPQASAEDAQAPADVAQLVAFIFDRFGRPGDAGALPDNVAAAVRRLERGFKAQADKNGGQQHAGEVLFWYRPRSDGWYEGPIHNDRIEEARKRSGAWVPLVAAPRTNAKDVRDAALEEAAHLMEQTGKRIAASDIRALKTQADKDGEACAKGDRNV